MKQKVLLLVVSTIVMGHHGIVASVIEQESDTKKHGHYVDSSPVKAREKFWGVSSSQNLEQRNRLSPIKDSPKSVLVGVSCEDRWTMKHLSCGYFFGVYDGHGGKEYDYTAIPDTVEKMVADVLRPKLFEEYNAENFVVDIASTTLHDTLEHLYDTDADIKKNLYDAFLSTDDAIEKYREKEREKMLLKGETYYSDECGATAVVGLLHGKNMYVAHAGDSRLVVGTGSTVRFSSKDHSRSNEDELKRLEGNPFFRGADRSYP